jgi:hypothetical protein
MRAQAPIIAAILIAIPAAVFTQSAAPGDGRIRGRVLDPDGQPMRDVQINLMELIDGSEFRSTRSVALRGDGTFDLPVRAGRILLMAQPRPRIVGDEPRLRRFITHPPVYFPGVFDRQDAWPIDVKMGEIVEFDFQFPPLPVGSFKTILTGPDGYVLDYIRVARPEANQLRTVKMSAEGVGHVDGLREGRYLVSARARSRDTQLAAWQIAFMTSGEIAVPLTLERAARVYGRIISERDGLPPLANTRVNAVWTDGTIDLDPLARDEADIAADGSFSIDGIFGFRQFRVAGLDSGWKVAAVRQGRSDITSGMDVAPGSTIEIAIVVSRK